MDLASPQFLHNPKASVSTVGYGDDGGVHAQFDDEFVKNEHKSAIEGRVVYDHYYIVELQWPGDNTKTFKYRFPIHQEKNEWIERFSRQWEAFRNSKQQVPDGTPIEMWAPLDKKRVYELKANRVFTVEQIAALTDQTGPNLGLDWRKMRDQAVAFLNPSASSAQISKLMRENEDKDNRMAAMEQQIAALSRRDEEDQPAAKRRGRPPRVQTETTES